MLKLQQNYLIALGGNTVTAEQGPADTLIAGAGRVSALVGAKIEVSALYATPCFPVGAGPDYVNAAARVVFDGGPQKLLSVLHEVEAEFGRARVQRWGQRTLDLDLIAAETGETPEDTVMPDAETQTRWRNLPLEAQIAATPDALILPHPRVQDRAFVLVPLAEIAPDWVHPLLGLTTLQMRDALGAEALAEVVRL